MSGATGYKLYVRRNLDPYRAGMDVGAPWPDADGAIRYLLVGLSIDFTNYFAVTSYDASGMESARSNEISLDYAAVAPFVDSDGDGLKDAEEDVNLNHVVDAGETDPRNPDSDGDGLRDGPEVRTYLTDPLRADTDGDRWPDGAEVAAGTDPKDSLSHPSGSPPQPTATPQPTPTAVSQGTCGNAQIEPGEQCDGTDDAACAGLCMSDCSCPRYLEIPLTGWSSVKGRGTWNVRPDDLEAHGPVLVTRTDLVPSAKFAVAYPSRPTLGAPLPLLAFTIRDDDYFAVEIVVTAGRGAVRVLSYEAADNPPSTRPKRATLPLGTSVSSGRLTTTYRDLAADVQRAFGMTLTRVEQIRLYGDLSASRIVLADRLPVSGGALGIPESIRLPLTGWARRGIGSVFANEYDPVLGGPTLRTDVVGANPARLQLTYPPARRVRLVAPFETLSLLVRDEDQFAVELKVRTSDGKLGKLRYQADLGTPIIRHHRATLPLLLTTLPDSPYRLLTVDLGADATLFAPGVTLDRVLAVKLQGKFRVADIVFSGPPTPARTRP